MHRAPEHQGFVSTRFTRALPNGTAGFLGGDVTYEGSKLAQVHNGSETGAHTYLDLRAGREAQRWSVTVWGKSVTDDDTPLDILRYIDTRQPLPPGFYSVFDSPCGFAITPPRPRQFGISASVRFRRRGRRP